MRVAEARLVRGPVATDKATEDTQDNGNLSRFIPQLVVCVKTILLWQQEYVLHW